MNPRYKEFSLDSRNSVAMMIVLRENGLMSLPFFFE